MTRTITMPPAPTSRLMLNRALWRALHERLKHAPDRAYNALYAKVGRQCRAFLRGHPLSSRVEAMELCNSLFIRLIEPRDTDPECRATDVERFLAENGWEQAVDRMGRWATQARALHGLAQQIADERRQRSHVGDSVLEVVEDPNERSDAELEQKETRGVGQVLLVEWCGRLDPDDALARAVMRKIVARLEEDRRPGRWCESRPLLLDPDIIWDLMDPNRKDKERRNVDWSYEVARNVRDRLETALRKLCRDAAAAGLGEGLEALWGYCAFRWRKPAAWRGGKQAPRFSEES